MTNPFTRTELLLGPEAMKRLAGCRVAVFGIGGVGGYTVEALARSGIGALNLIDDDRVSLSNLNQDQFDFTQYDYIVDAIDTMKGKLALVEKAEAAGTPIICAMGAGNKLDPTAFRVADIYQTTVCPLARIMRTECRKRGIRKLKVVYSKELPVRPTGEIPEDDRKGSTRRDIPGSVAFVPAAAGLIIAGEVIKDLCASEP